VRRIGLRPSARRDLADIWIHTANHRGLDQAERYFGAIRREIESLGEFPERHPAHPSRHGNFRKAASGVHFVFYLVFEEEIEVVRMLHARMDATSLSDE
tara:strand:- start:2945 stop:3241 length:297 start_codon:yes stop_codon:yes gene_type:complete